MVDLIGNVKVKYCILKECDVPIGDDTYLYQKAEAEHTHCNSSRRLSGVITSIVSFVSL